MCVAIHQPSDAGAEDMVQLYGLDRVRDRELLERLWRETHDVQRACYLLGYRKVVGGLEPYLRDAARWYARLTAAPTDPVALLNWRNRASYDGHAERLLNVRNKLEVLWQVVHENSDFVAQLPQGVKKPEDVVSELNSAHILGLRDHIQWDETAQQKLRDVSPLPAPFS